LVGISLRPRLRAQVRLQAQLLETLGCGLLKRSFPHSRAKKAARKAWSVWRITSRLSPSAVLSSTRIMLLPSIAAKERLRLWFRSRRHSPGVPARIRRVRANHRRPRYYAPPAAVQSSAFRPP